MRNRKEGRLNTSELPNHANLFPREVSSYLRVSLTYVYDLISLGQLPANRIAGQYRIPRQKFLSWWEKQSTNGD
jgi:excisionase family DNA binding protein